MENKTFKYNACCVCRYYTHVAINLPFTRGDRFISYSSGHEFRSFEFNSENCNHHDSKAFGYYTYIASPMETIPQPDYVVQLFLSDATHVTYILHMYIVFDTT